MPQQIDPNTGQPIGVNMGDPMIPQYIPGLPGLTKARLVNGAEDLKPFEYLRNEGGRYYAQNALTNPEEGGAAIPPPVQYNPGSPSVSLPPPSPPPGVGFPPPTEAVNPNSGAGPSVSLPPPSPPPGMSSPAVMPPNFEKMFRGFNPFAMGGWGGLPRPYGGRLRQDAAQTNMGMGAISQGVAQPSWGMPQTGGGDPNPFNPLTAQLPAQNGASQYDPSTGAASRDMAMRMPGGFQSFGFPMMRRFGGSMWGGSPSGLPTPV
jgi:hypothetical protein